MSSVDRRERLLVRLVVEQPAGPSNGYRVDTRSGAITLADVEAELPAAPIEHGILARTLGANGKPLTAIMPVRVPTFRGCIVPARPLAVLTTPAGMSVIVVVPDADPILAAATTLIDLDRRTIDALRAIGMPVGGAEEAQQLVRDALEAERRSAAAVMQEGRALVAWKVSDERPPDTRGGEAQSHTFAEQAVPRLPARFQEYIARALLPEERILLFVTRPAMRLRRGFVLGRRLLLEGLLIVTDRQVMVMTDSTSADSTFVHWGYIARTSAVERLAGVRVREDSEISLTVEFAAAYGREAITVVFPRHLRDAVVDAAELLRGFVPADGGQALRRLYPRVLPRALPDMAAVFDRAVPPPAWAHDLIADESILAWAEAPADRRPPPRIVVGERSVAITGAAYIPTQGERMPITAITSLEMTLSLLASRFELAVAEGEGVRRIVLRFDYPAAPPFLTAFTAARHLMGLPLSETYDG